LVSVRKTPQHERYYEGSFQNCCCLGCEMSFEVLTYWAVLPKNFHRISSGSNFCGDSFRQFGQLFNRPASNYPRRTDSLRISASYSRNEKTNPLFSGTPCMQRRQQVAHIQQIHKTDLYANLCKLRSHRYRAEFNRIFSAALPQRSADRMQSACRHSHSARTAPRIFNMITISMVAYKLHKLVGKSSTNPRLWTPHGDRNHVLR